MDYELGIGILTHVAITSLSIASAILSLLYATLVTMDRERLKKRIEELEDNNWKNGFKIP